MVTYNQMLYTYSLFVLYIKDKLFFLNKNSFYFVLGFKYASIYFTKAISSPYHVLVANTVS